MKSRGRPAWILAAILLLPGFSRASLAGDESAAPQLPAWPADLDLLATDREKELFFTLQGEAERRFFLQQFWQARDPIPQTSRNELREAWESRLAEADRRWHGLADDRSRVYLLRGEPSSAFDARCAKSGSFEIWIYEPGFRIERRLVVAFLAGAGAGGAARCGSPAAPPTRRRRRWSCARTRSGLATKPGGSAWWGTTATAPSWPRPCLRPGRGNGSPASTPFRSAPRRAPSRSRLRWTSNMWRRGTTGWWSA